MESFLPWLVVIILFLVTGPPIMVWKYFDNVASGREWLGILILSVGLPWCKKQIGIQYLCASVEEMEL